MINGKKIFDEAKNHPVSIPFILDKPDDALDVVHVGRGDGCQTAVVWGMMYKFPPFVIDFVTQETKQSGWQMDYSKHKWDGKKFIWVLIRKD